MNRHLLFKVCLILTFFFSYFGLRSQDIHFSQFYNSPLNLSPALTGIFNGDKRITGSLKDQWRTVPVPWFTFGASYEHKFIPKRSENYFFTGGLQFNYDRQGLSRLNLSNFNLSLAYTRAINQSNLLTAGILLGYATRGFSLDQLTWDKQWNGDFLDPSLPTGEAFDAQRIHFLETALGLNYRWQKSKRTKLDLGAGLFHFIEPSIAFYNSDDQKLPRRLSLYGVGSFKLIDLLDIQLHAMTQFQSDYRETVFGAIGKIHIDQNKGKEFELHLGLGYRTSKSLIPTIAIQYRQLYVGFNYDIDISDFDTYTNNKGGPEFHIRYIITHVKPLRKFKVCSIF